MLEWIYGTAERVDEFTNRDPEYQELARQQRWLVDDFEALLKRLQKDDRELLLEYMEVVGNMQYRKTQLAWQYGRLHPKK